MQKFEFLRQPLLGELAMSRKRERKRKMPFIVATYVYDSSQGQRTHSARTNNQSQATNEMHFKSVESLVVMCNIFLLGVGEYELNMS